MKIFEKISNAIVKDDIRDWVKKIFGFEAM